MNIFQRTIVEARDKLARLINDRFNHLENRMTALDAAIASADAKVTALTAEVTTLTTKVDMALAALATSIGNQTPVTQAELDAIQATGAKADAGLSAVQGEEAKVDAALAPPSAPAAAPAGGGGPGEEHPAA